MKIKPLIVPVLVILVGLAWLLNELDIFPPIDWVWSAGLAVVGVLVLTLNRLERMTFVIGGFLLVAAAASVARQTGRLRLEVEVPVLVIALGVLMLAAQLLGLPGRSPVEPPKKA